MKHEPTGIAKSYFDFINNGAPKCCHTCQHYNKNGVCETWNNSPPPEFTNQINACEHWFMDTPF